MNNKYHQKIKHHEINVFQIFIKTSQDTLCKEKLMICMIYKIVKWISFKFLLRKVKTLFGMKHSWFTWYITSRSVVKNLTEHSRLYEHHTIETFCKSFENLLTLTLALFWKGNSHQRFNDLTQWCNV